MLTSLSICLYERVLNSIIEKSNLALGQEIDSQLMKRLSSRRQQDENVLETFRAEKTRDSVISVIYSPGFSSADSGTVVDLIRNVADDLLLRWWFTYQPRESHIVGSDRELNLLQSVIALLPLLL